MNKDKLDIIKNKINNVKVINYKEDIIEIDSKFLSLKKGIYTLNNNKNIYRDTIVKNMGTGNAVVIIPLTSDNKIVITIQARCSLPTDDKVSIELPAGYIEKGEDIIESSKRELEEETGYKSNNLKLIDSYYPSLGASGEAVYLVIAIDCKKIGNTNFDSDEYIEYDEVTIEELKYLIDNGYIKDASSRISYYKILEYFDSK